MMRPGTSARDAYTVNQPGYTLRQRIRKRIEEASGWMKSIGVQRKTRNLALVQIHVYSVAAA